MSRPRFPCLLFDLDGTLLDVEIGAFLDAYFALAAQFLGRPGERERVAAAMTGAARAAMRATDGARTVDRVFLDAFAPSLPATPERARELLDDFHRGALDRLRAFVRPIPAARPLIERALALGCELVLASNPVFFLEPIRARARWAGLGDVPFSLVTGAELMRWTKPHSGYYRQVLALRGRRPEQCLMVGDDPRMDMAAGGAGIATWLAVRDGDPPREAPLADRRGTLQQLADWLEA